MRRLAIVLALCVLSACTREGYVIDACIEGLDGEISLVDMFDHVISSSPVQNGKFRFEGVVDTPQLMYLNNGLGQKYPVDTPVLLENARIKVRGSKVVNHYESVARAKVNTSVGKKYVNFEILGPDGKSVPLAEVVDSNEVTVLVLWASWARQASNTLSSYVDACSPYMSRGLTMFCVSMDYNKDAWASMSETAGLFGLNFCDTVAKGQEVEALYGIDGLPSAVIIGSDGTIIGRCRSGADVRKVIEAYYGDKQQ